jgi:hypothetical protein
MRHLGEQISSLRDLLRPSLPHTCLMSIKILHLELAMLAQLSGDTILLQALQAPDPMGFLASSLVQVSPLQACMRSARAVPYGCMSGQGSTCANMVHVASSVEQNVTTGHSIIFLLSARFFR